MSPNTEQLILSALSEIRIAQIGHAEHIAAVKKQVEIYLGNGQPGIIPSQLADMKQTINAHSDYIEEQKGSTDGKKQVKADWVTRVLMLGSLLTSCLALFELWRHMSHMGG